MLRAEGQREERGLDDAALEPTALAGMRNAQSGLGPMHSLDDVYDARRVAETIGIPTVVNHGALNGPSVRQKYLSGRTPIL
jgi:hypothetical protein